MYKSSLVLLGECWRPVFCPVILMKRSFIPITRDNLSSLKKKNTLQIDRAVTLPTLVKELQNRLITFPIQKKCETSWFNKCLGAVSYTEGEASGKIVLKRIC